MGKSENCVFLETVPATGLKVGLSIQINDFINFNEYQRSRSSLDLGQRSLGSKKSNLFFWEIVESLGTKFHMEAYG